VIIFRIRLIFDAVFLIQKELFFYIITKRN